MFYRNTNVKHLNIRIVSLAAGLALATAAVIGGSEVLEEKSDSNSASVTPRAERIVPQFGTAADAVFASQGIRAPSQFGTAADAVYAAESLRPRTSSVDIDSGAYLGLGQPATGQSFANMADAVYALEGIRPQTGTVVDTGDYLGLGQPAAGQSFGTDADAVFAVESLLAQQEVASVVTSIDASGFLGLGQPGEGVHSESPQFGTMADADYASR
jgi:hypothetical protein